MSIKRLISLGTSFGPTSIKTLYGHIPTQIRVAMNCHKIVFLGFIRYTLSCMMICITNKTARYAHCSSNLICGSNLAELKWCPTLKNLLWVKKNIENRSTNIAICKSFLFTCMMIPILCACQKQTFFSGITPSIIVGEF